MFQNLLLQADESELESDSGISINISNFDPSLANQVNKGHCIIIHLLFLCYFRTIKRYMLNSTFNHITGVHWALSFIYSNYVIKEK